MARVKKPKNLPLPIPVTETVVLPVAPVLSAVDRLIKQKDVERDLLRATFRKRREARGAWKLDPFDEAKFRLYVSYGARVTKHNKTLREMRQAIEKARAEV